MKTHAEWLDQLRATETRHRLRRVGNIARRVMKPGLGLNESARIAELEEALSSILIIANSPIR